MTTLDFNELGHTAGKPTLRPFVRVKTLFARMRFAALRRQAFQDVSGLDAHLLRDIGLSWDDVHDGMRGRHRSVWLEPMPQDEGRLNP